MAEEYVRVGALVPEIKLANPIFNSEKIIEKLNEANQKGIEVVATPELSLTGASCGDLFNQKILMEETEKAISKICESTKEIESILVLGTPAKISGKLYNVALLIHKGAIIGIVPKKNLTRQEYRWFNSGSELYEKTFNVFGTELTFDRNVFKVPNNENAAFAITLSETIIEYLNPENIVVYVCLNMTSANDVASKTTKVKQEARTLSFDNGIGYVYLMPGINESSSNSVYSGYSLIVDDGKVMCEGKKFSFESTLIYGDIKLNEESVEIDKENGVVENYRTPLDSKEKQAQKELDPFPFIPEQPDKLAERVDEILELQSSALARRIKQLGNCKVVLGLSGGSDSTLALIVADRAYKKLGLDNKHIVAITMPGFGTSGRTYNNAVGLAKYYDVDLRDISIKDSCIQHYKDIGLPEDDRSITYENAQARERTQILMDVANMENGFVLGTGDMSELALGWCTYNGDHMSMYGINANLPKTLIMRMLKFEAQRTGNPALLDISKTPISPELLPPDEQGDIAQKTESEIGPYELHDYFLYHFIRYGSTPKHLLDRASVAFEGKIEKEEIEKWLKVFLKKFITQQFKRNCVPDGPTVGTVGLSPRGDLVMPSDADRTIWSI